MDENNRNPADLVANLCLDPGFVLVPQDRFAELIRAETERDVLEFTIRGENGYSAKNVMAAILAARRAGVIPDGLNQDEQDGEPDAE